jgi:hypothetical protein
MKSSKFTTFFEGWTPAYEVFPVVNNSNLLLGGFTVLDGGVFKGFISVTGPESMAAANGSLYATPSRDESGAITLITISDMKLTEESRLITIEEEHES